MSGNDVMVTDGYLVVEPMGFDRWWSFTRKLRIPLAHVKDARVLPSVEHEPKGWRGPGLRAPGKLSGTFHANGGRQFWNITGYENALIIELGPEERFDRLILTVEDPIAVAKAINEALEAN